MVHSQKNGQLLNFMSNTKYIKIGGVPEHFNLPWTQAFSENKTKDLGVEISWNFFPGGTGAMTQALKNGSLDVAILLTEGYLAAVQNSLDARIIQCYIESPLQWGIYSNKKSTVHFDSKTKIAISRKGSGSHLMPMIHAQQMGYRLQDDQFEVIHHLDDGIAALSKDCDYFYWEKWMTLPFVQKGLVNKVGEFSAPWSGFLVVARQSCIDQFGEELQQIIAIIQHQVRTFTTDPESPKNIERKFHLDIEEARKWIAEQRWNYSHDISQQGLLNALSGLASIGIDTTSINIEQLCAPWLSLR
jgi:ABC-type nitrate/sulfonate/bicarbonate transport system substrate-binding protein